MTQQIADEFRPDVFWMEENDWERSTSLSWSWLMWNDPCHVVTVTRNDPCQVLKITMYCWWNSRENTNEKSWARGSVIQALREPGFVSCRQPYELLAAAMIHRKVCGSQPECRRISSAPQHPHLREGGSAKLANGQKQVKFCGNYIFFLISAVITVLPLDRRQVMLCLVTLTDLQTRRASLSASAELSGLSSRAYSRWGRLPRRSTLRRNLCDCWWKSFYRPDVLAVTQL